jgi:hypothetical protein
MVQQVHHDTVAPNLKRRVISLTLDDVPAHNRTPGQ